MTNSTSTAIPCTKYQGKWGPFECSFESTDGPCGTQAPWVPEEHYDTSTKEMRGAWHGQAWCDRHRPDADPYFAEKARLIAKAIRQIDRLGYWEGGSLRLEAFQIKDTMDALIALVDSGSTRSR